MIHCSVGGPGALQMCLRIVANKCISDGDRVNYLVKTWRERELQVAANRVAKGAFMPVVARVGAVVARVVPLCKGKGIRTFSLRRPLSVLLIRTRGDNADTGTHLSAIREERSMPESACVRG